MDSTALSLCTVNSDNFWTAFSALATLGTGIVVLISVWILAWQLGELKRATYAQGWFFAMNHLQNEDARGERRELFELDEKGYEKLSDELKAKWKDLAEKACHRYDCIGVMAKNKMFPKNLATKSYGYSVLRTWKACSQLVQKYQEQRGPDFWAHLTWLVEEAKKNQTFPNSK